MIGNRVNVTQHLSGKEILGNFIIAVVGILAFCILSVAVISSFMTTDQQRYHEYTDTTTVRVVSGDNITQLLLTHSFPLDNINEFDMRRVIRIVYDLNDLETAEIFHGQRLVLPVYGEVDDER